MTAALQERTESPAVEPLSVAIFGAAEALGPLVAAHRASCPPTAPPSC